MTEASAKLFEALARDAGNWSGTPPLGHNVATDAASRGNVTQLKVLGLITTYREDGDTWVDFTAAGMALATEMGIHI